MKPVESSQIHSVGYDPLTKTLAVRFHGPKGKPSALYHYADVAPAKFADFERAESKGKWFHQHIKRLPQSHPCARQGDN
ncbi:MAG: KTSC domain-containing protein [Bradyrhizobium sp.]|nr:KTSC domain-containing protein [Bradyrhizobium sp.]